MKKIVGVLLVFAGIASFSSSEVKAWCFGKIGSTCAKKDGPKQEEPRALKDDRVIRINMVAPPPTQGTTEDGAARRKSEKGDKSQEQGYSEYREHFIYYRYEGVSIPHYKAKKNASTSNRTISHEYALNPYISVQTNYTELKNESHRNSEDIWTAKHLYTTLNLRVYVLSRVVLRAGIGLGQGQISRGSGKTTARISALTNSILFIWGDENTMLGLTSTTLEGSSGTDNMGVSMYGITAGMGF